MGYARRQRRTAKRNKFAEQFKRMWSGGPGDKTVYEFRIMTQEDFGLKMLIQIPSDPDEIKWLQAFAGACGQVISRLDKPKNERPLCYTCDNTIDSIGDLRALLVIKNSFEPDKPVAMCGAFCPVCVEANTINELYDRAHQSFKKVFRDAEMFGEVYTRPQ